MHCELAISVLNSPKWFENLKFDFNLEFPKLTKAKNLQKFQFDELNKFREFDSTSSRPNERHFQPMAATSFCDHLC